MNISASAGDEIGGELEGLAGLSETEEDEDSPTYITEGYEKETIWDGLHLIEYVPVPHYESEGYIGIKEYAQNLKKDKIQFKTMTDDQAIVINGDKEEFLG